MAVVRILVIEDSLTVRQRLIEVLGADPGVEVVGEASDGRTGIALCERLRPDLVTLDIVLPDMSGVAVTEHIMAHVPTPILVISAAENRGEAYDTYSALAAGAVDVLDKPTGGDLGQWERQLLATAKLVAKIKVIRHIRGRNSAWRDAGSAPEGAQPAPARVPAPPGATGQGRPSGAGTAEAGGPHEAAAGGDRASGDGWERGGPYRLVAIGASTGGPAAIAEVLRGLPVSFPLPLLVVLHISEPFARSFVDWLDAQSPIPVGLAQDGDPVPPLGRARVIVAPADHHLVVAGERLRLTKGPERNACRPSVDTLFLSLADGGHAHQVIGCLLTGMGRDGASGLLALRRAGARTIVQNETTSVVWGMPREALEIGAAERVLPLQEVAPALCRLAGLPVRARRTP